MSFELKKTPNVEVQPPPISDAGAADDAPPQDSCPQGSVFCRHGIHNGWFPIQGMRMGDARQVLNTLLNVDPEAVAVINGNIVDDDYVIGEDIEMINFVKKSSIKG